MHTDLIVAVPNWVLLAYLISGVCFILALRGLSGPESSRRGNRIGMIGMAIAVLTTLATHQIASLPEIVAATAPAWSGWRSRSGRRLQRTDWQRLRRSLER